MDTARDLESRDQWFEPQAGHVNIAFFVFHLP